jgi:hypothetical protein
MAQVAGRKWFEAAVAIVALLVSAVSLWVAIGTEDANRKMVSAASWPLIQFVDSDADETSHTEILKLSILNAGVGPAKIETFALTWRGRAMHDTGELLRTCCGYVRSADVTQRPLTSTVPQTVLRAGETRPFLIYARTLANAAVYDRLNDARQSEIGYSACYCSVFNECWTSDGHAVDPMPVKACVAPAVPYRA